MVLPETGGASGPGPAFRQFETIGDEIAYATKCLKAWHERGDFLGDIAGFSGLDSRDVLDFAGIDRTTVSRRKASGSALPQDAAVKALQITDLLTQATEVFGSPAQASTWLTRPHPSLDGETPLKRARTPWGMSKVQSILVALRYGAAA